MTHLYALFEVGTLELTRDTTDGRTVHLVLFVKAVVVSVAHPRRRDAVAGARTRELWVDTNMTSTSATIPTTECREQTYLEVCARLLGAMWPFVGAVPAVVLGITSPSVGHTSPTVTPELRRTACDVDAASLVRKVATVVLRIALEGSRNAAPRLAHELVTATRSL